MAARDWFKIYDNEDEYVAATRHAEDAAVLVSVIDHATIKYSGRIVWREDREEFSAGESYDRAAGIIWERIQEHSAERLRKRYGPKAVIP